MNCPKCAGVTLSVTHRSGIEVDTCPQCRGIWLDRDEIDRLVAAVGPMAVPADDSIAPAEFAPQPSPYGPGGDGEADDPLDDLRSTEDASRHDYRDDDDDDDDDGDDNDERDRHRARRKREKKRSFAYRLGEALEEIFDL